MDSDSVNYSQSDADRGYFDSMTSSLNTDERSLVSQTQTEDTLTQWRRLSTQMNEVLSVRRRPTILWLNDVVSQHRWAKSCQSNADRGYFDSMTSSLNTDERSLVSQTQIEDTLTRWRRLSTQMNEVLSVRRRPRILWLDDVVSQHRWAESCQSGTDRGYFDSMTSSLNTDERSLVSLAQVFDEQYDVNSGYVDHDRSTDVCRWIYTVAYSLFYKQRLGLALTNINAGLGQGSYGFGLIINALALTLRPRPAETQPHCFIMNNSQYLTNFIQMLHALVVLHSSRAYFFPRVDSSCGHIMLACLIARWRVEIPIRFACNNFWSNVTYNWNVTWTKIEIWTQ